MTLLVLASVAALVALALAIWLIDTSRSRREEQERALVRLGFAPCPEETDAVREIVELVERNREYAYEVRDLRKLDGDSPVHLFTAVRVRSGHEDAPFPEETLLFRIDHRADEGVVVVVKPTSLASGVATRLIGSVATAGWDAQPDDLHRLEVPADLRGGNVIGALGPRGANLHDLLDPGVLAVVQGLGDAGAIRMTLRDGWCLAASGGRHLPFRMEELLARIRPVLAREVPVTPMRVRRSA